jgi:16S rRNA processing protein RimM
LRLRILTDYPERIGKLKQVYLGASPESRVIKPYTVQSMRMHKAYGLLTLAEVSDRDEADLLRELKVMIPLDQAVPLEDDEVYLYQLIGLRVQTQEGAIIGTISDVLETGANDVYVIDSDEFGEVLLPVIPQTILETNIEAGHITVEIPEGLLPDK